MINENTMHAMSSAPQGMAGHPLARGAMMAATGFAAGRGLLGGLNPFNPLRNPLLLLAGGIAAGYLMHKYEKEIVAAVAKVTGLGKDFALHQKENLEDLVAEARDQETQQAKSPPPAQP